MPTFTAGDNATNRIDHHPEGNYLCAVIGAEEKTSKAGSEMIELKCEVIGPDVPEEEGAIFYDYLVFSESSFWKITRALRAMGMTFEDDEEVEIEAPELEGKTFEATLTVEDFKGRKSNKVGDYLVPDGPF